MKNRDIRTIGSLISSTIIGSYEDGFARGVTDAKAAFTKSPVFTDTLNTSLDLLTALRDVVGEALDELVAPPIAALVKARINELIEERNQELAEKIFGRPGENPGEIIRQALEAAGIKGAVVSAVPISRSADELARQPKGRRRADHQHETVAETDASAVDPERPN